MTPETETTPAGDPASVPAIPPTPASGPPPKKARLHYFTTMTAGRFLVALSVPIACIAALTFWMGTCGKETAEYRKLRDWRDFAMALGAATGTVLWQARVRYVQKVEGWCTELVRGQLQFMKIVGRPIGGPATWKPDGAQFQDAVVSWSCSALGLQGLGIAFTQSRYQAVWDELAVLVKAFRAESRGEARDLRGLAKQVALRMMELAEDVRR